MKTNMIVRLGISMLVMLMTIGTVSADGGASYSDAESITVPYGTTDVWVDTTTSTDWYQFSIEDNGDDIYVDLQKTFVTNGGELKVHDDYEGDIEAWVSSSHNDHTADLRKSPQPRIEIAAGTQSSYQFIAGLNFNPPL